MSHLSSGSLVRYQEVYVQGGLLSLDFSNRHMSPLTRLACVLAHKLYDTSPYVLTYKTSLCSNLFDLF